MPRYVTNDSWTYKYQQNASSIRTIVIEEGVTYLGEYAFSMFPNVTSVTLPSSLEAIGAFAFKDMTSLTSISIPAGAVNESAFINCNGLRTVTIGPGVTQFGISAFEGCRNINRVNIASVESWCNIDFGGVYANPMSPVGGSFGTRHLYLTGSGSPISNLVIPNGVSQIPDYAFDNCPDITSVTIPSSVKSIGEYAFRMNRALSTVHVSEGLEEIGAVAFNGTRCTAFDFPRTLKYIGAYAFRAVPIGAMRINSGYIGKNAFADCGAMWCAGIGTGVTVDDNAFHNCPAIRNTVNPSSMTVPMTFRFGRFNGQDIEWMVLAMDEYNHALVVSSKVLKNLKFYDGPEYNTDGWAQSDVRTWLNDEFHNSAFTPTDKLRICNSYVSPDFNDRYGTEGGDETTDKIFLLSASEMEMYLPTPQARAAVTLAGGSHAGDIDTSVGGTGYYWLRTPGIAEDFAVYVDYCGHIRYDGAYTTNPDIFGVRPAMWLDISGFGITSTTTTKPTSPDHVNGADAPIYDFVTRLYSLCLNRVPDYDGCVSWYQKLKLGWLDGATVAQGFFMSQEMTNRHLSNSDFVEVLYNVMMGRASDGSGKKYWREALDCGVSRAGALRGFAESAEFTRICASYGINRGSLPPAEPRDVNFGVTMFVARCYTKALNRAYDIGGINKWCSRINNSPSPRAEAIYVSTTGFFDSQEFINRHLSNNDFVEVLYRTFLGRNSDPAGKAGWVAQLNAGADRHAIMAGFYNSAEFNRIMASYGL